MDKRKADLSYRSLRTVEGAIDFSSNDYLGFARDGALKERIAKRVENTAGIGATGSRLLSGQYDLLEELEAHATEFHEATSALFFPSGYHANSGLIATVVRPADLILFDELSHSSLREGIKLSRAEAIPFPHNKLDFLETALQKVKGKNKGVFVLVESVYSMDGDQADLQALAQLCDRYGAKLIVDEAHATGLFGPDGAGLVQEAGVAQLVFARVHTYGKAMGSNGGMLLCSREVRDYLINFCKAFIYTTAPPVWQTAAVLEAYKLLPSCQDRIAQIDLLGQQLAQTAREYSLPIQRNAGSIQSMIFPGNEKVIACAEKLEQAGFDVRPIRYPTVAKGQERLRINLHAFNTTEDLQGLLSALVELKA